MLRFDDTAPVLLPLEAGLRGLPVSQRWTRDLPRDGGRLGALCDLEARCGLAPGALDPRDLSRINDAIVASAEPVAETLETRTAPKRTFALHAAPLETAGQSVALAVRETTGESELRAALQRAHDALRAARSAVGVSHCEAVELALTDGLTGLPNRRAFNFALAEACDVGAFTLVLMDMDRFKAVNDRLGHATGDALLAATAERLRRTLRASDAVFRLGGDEFAAILPGVTGEAEAEAGAQRIVEAFRTRLALPDVEVGVGLTVGVALHEAGQGADALYRRADVALHAAKRRARGTVHLASQTGPRLDDHDALCEVRAILEQGEVPLAVGTLAGRGGGTMARTARPVRGAGQARPLATLFDTAQTFGVGRDLLSTFARSLALAARAAGGAIVHVAVPTEALSIRDAARIVAAELSECAVDPSRIVLECAAVAPGTPAAATIAALRAHGAKVVLDGWDLGLAALAQLENGAADGVRARASDVRALLATHAGRTFLAAALAALPDGALAIAGDLAPSDAPDDYLSAGFAAAEAPTAAAKSVRLALAS